jgi:hypothetical protein
VRASRAATNAAHAECSLVSRLSQPIYSLATSCFPSRPSDAAVPYHSWSRHLLFGSSLESRTEILQVQNSMDRAGFCGIHCCRCTREGRKHGRLNGTTSISTDGTLFRVPERRSFEHAGTSPGRRGQVKEECPSAPPVSSSSPCQATGQASFTLARSPASLRLVTSDGPFPQARGLGEPPSHHSSSGSWRPRRAGAVGRWPQPTAPVDPGLPPGT